MLPLSPEGHNSWSHRTGIFSGKSTTGTAGGGNKWKGWSRDHIPNYRTKNPLWLVLGSVSSGGGHRSNPTVHLRALSCFYRSKFGAMVFLVFSRTLRWSAAETVPEAWVCCCWQGDAHCPDWSQGYQLCPEHLRPCCRQGAVGETRDGIRSRTVPCSLLTSGVSLN